MDAGAGKHRRVGSAPLASPFGSSRSRSSHRPPSLEAPPPPLLRRLIDGCFLGLLLVAPLLMGGRHPLGQGFWMLLAACLGVATLLHYRMQQPTAGDLLWLAAALLVTLQLIPLPTSWLQTLNPGLSALLPGMEDPASMPFSEVLYQSRPISIAPYRTRLALGMTLAYGIIFHAAIRRLQNLADIKRLFAWIAISTSLICVLALAQRFLGNGKFLWVYEHLSRDASDVVKGPFQNQNHLAQLIALGIGPLLYFATLKQRPWQTILTTVALTLCLLTGLLTFSRGGVIAIMTALLVASAGLIATGQIDRRRAARVLMAIVLTGLLLGIWGGDRLLPRVATLLESSDLAVLSPGRFALWEAHVQAIAASPWVGYGAASHQEVYPAFITRDFGVTFTHGESGYLPIQLENGLIGTGLLVAVFCLVGWWLRQAWQSQDADSHPLPAQPSRPPAPPRRVLVTLCAAGLAASAIQSIGDFVWYLPACLTPTLLLLACLQRLAVSASACRPQSFLHSSPFTKMPWLAIPCAGLLAAVSWSIAPARASHLWKQYRMAVRAERVESPDNDPSPFASDERIALLQAVIERDPDNPSPRLRLANELLKRQAASQAAASHSIPDWPEQVTRQALLGLRGAPFRSEGYIALALAFHQLRSEPAGSLSLLDQARRVNRSDVTVAYQAGLAALQTGHPEWGLESWKTLIETPSPPRTRILRPLIARLPAEVFLQSFSLDRECLAILYEHHRQAPGLRQEVALEIGTRYVQELIAAATNAVDPKRGTAFLYRASHVTLENGGSNERVIELASRAVQQSPTDYRSRLWLSDRLLAEGRYAEAKEHIEWCQLRKPFDPQVSSLAERFTRHSLQR